MALRFAPLPTDLVRALQAGGPDAYGAPPERAVAGGGPTPCRHCLRHISEGRPFLILAYRPFPAPQPYAETGPIFLCAEACEPWGGETAPPILRTSPDYLLRGYGPDDRIVYGTGGVVAREAVEARAEALLDDPRVAYVHVRSARNNCYQLGIVRGG